MDNPELKPVLRADAPFKLVVDGKILGIVESMTYQFAEVPGFAGRQITDLEITLRELE